MKKLLPLCFPLLFQACNNNTVNKEIKTELRQKIVPNDVNKNTEVFKDSFVFDSNNHEAEYKVVKAKKGNKLYLFITDENNHVDLLNGDVCEIVWRKNKNFNYLISVLKIKDGNVSIFRTKYQKEIKYHWFENNNYSEDRLNDIYLLAEYYIANSKNKFINLAIQSNEQLEYSIENRTENNKEYYVLGIGYTFEHRFTTMQWIYIDIKTMQIFEYDLANDQLVKFN